MKTCYSSTVELRQHFARVVETHPYECGRGNEASFFVEAHDAEPGTAVTLRVQVSTDGIRCIDEGTAVDVMDSTFARVIHFGGFLRLVGRARTAAENEAGVTTSVRLALKG
jgi:hypothetical protein